LSASNDKLFSGIQETEQAFLSRVWGVSTTNDMFYLIMLQQLNFVWI